MQVIMILMLTGFHSTHA